MTDLSSVAAIAAAVSEALEGAPTVYVLLNGRYSDGSVSGSLMLDTGDLLWSLDATDVDALKEALVFESPRLERLVDLYPDGYRVEVIEGELPGWLAEANRAFVEATAPDDLVASDEWGVGVRVPCPNSTVLEDGDGPRCDLDCPVCSGSGSVDAEVTR